MRPTSTTKNSGTSHLLPCAGVRTGEAAPAWPWRGAKKKGLQHDVCNPLISWCRKEDSNLRPTDYESVALPTELFRPNRARIIGSRVVRDKCSTPPPRRQPHGLGFTLLELIVTVAIATIVLTLGVPNFQSMLQNNRVRTALSDLTTDLNLARSEAIKRGTNVTVCKSSDGANCTTAADYGQGWIVRSQDGTVLKVHPALPAWLSLVGTANTVSRIDFQSYGRATNGDLAFCKDGQVLAGITISATGRIRSASADEVSCS